MSVADPVADHRVVSDTFYEVRRASRAEFPGRVEARRCARPRPACGPSGGSPGGCVPGLEGTTEEGQAWLRLSTRGERTRDHFHVGVEIPVDTLGIATLEELEARSVEFSVNGQLVCTLVADAMDLLEERVEFAADVRTRNGVVVRQLGDCGNAIPAIAENDAASVELDGAMLLEGMFELRERGAG